MTHEKSCLSVFFFLKFDMLIIWSNSFWAKEMWIELNLDLIVVLTHYDPSKFDLIHSIVTPIQNKCHSYTYISYYELNFSIKKYSTSHPKLYVAMPLQVWVSWSKWKVQISIEAKRYLICYLLLRYKVKKEKVKINL